MIFGKRAEAPAQQPNPPRPEPAPPYVQTSQDPLEVGGPVPKTIGRVADLYRDIRELRLSMEKEAEKV